MPDLFETTVLNGMVLRNRFVHSATNEGMANLDDGCANERLIRWQEQVAEGEIGLLIPGYVYISDQGKSRPGQAGVHSDVTLPGLARMAEVVHRHGARLVLQLAHAGGNVYVPSDSGYALGPSDMKLTDVPCRAKAKELGDAASQSASRLGSRFKDDDVKQRFRQAGDAAETFGKSVAEYFKSDRKA